MVLEQTHGLAWRIQHTCGLAQEPGSAAELHDPLSHDVEAGKALAVCVPGQSFDRDRVVWIEIGSSERPFGSWPLTGGLLIPLRSAKFCADATDDMTEPLLAKPNSVTIPP